MPVVPEAAEVAPVALDGPAIHPPVADGVDPLLVALEDDELAPFPALTTAPPVPAEYAGVPPERAARIVIDTADGLVPLEVPPSDEFAPEPVPAPVPEAPDPLPKVFDEVAPPAM